MSSKVYKLFVCLLLFCVATIRVEAVAGGKSCEVGGTLVLN